MARARNRLNSKIVQAITEPGRYSDGGGLYVDRDRAGRARWLYFFTWNGKRREMGLGPCPTVSLADARKARDKAERLVRDGKDPIRERDDAKKRAAGVPSFGEVADALFEAKKAGWRHAVHREQWRRSIEVEAKTLRHKPVDQIGVEDVLGVLTPLWTSKPENGSRLRQRIEAVLDAAKAQGHRTGENPAAWRGHLAHLLPKRQRLTRGHHAALPYTALPAFMAKLRAYQARSIAAYALEFAILTAARSNEVYGAIWGEIDMKAKVWTVPGARMKSGREHRVPLGDRAIEILAKMERVKVGDFIFPGRSAGGRLSHIRMGDVLSRLGVEDATVHGFRSSFRDWAGETTPFPREVAEAALAHAVGDETERAYRRGDALEKRRQLMSAWAAFIEPKNASNVIPLRPAGREQQESGAA